MTAMDATVGSRQPRGSRRPRPWARWIPLGWTALVVAYLVATYRIANDSLYVQSVVLTAAIFAILAVSLDLVAGATGLYSLGHAGLFALGAYTPLAYMTDRWVYLRAQQRKQRPPKG